MTSSFALKYFLGSLPGFWYCFCVQDSCPKCQTLNFFISRKFSVCINTFWVQAWVTRSSMSDSTAELQISSQYSVCWNRFQESCGSYIRRLFYYLESVMFWVLSICSLVQKYSRQGFVLCLGIMAFNFEAIL